MTSDLPVQREFFKQLGGRPQIAQLFDELPDIYFLAKNVCGEFVLCNSATLAALGLEREADMIGKTDYEIVPAEIADQYREADRAVLETGRAVRNLIEPVPDAKGVVTWYATSKISLFGKDDKVEPEADDQFARGRESFLKTTRRLPLLLSLLRVLPRASGRSERRLQSQLLCDLPHTNLAAERSASPHAPAHCFCRHDAINKDACLCPVPRLFHDLFECRVVTRKRVPGLPLSDAELVVDPDRISEPIPRRFLQR